MKKETGKLPDWEIVCSGSEIIHSHKRLERTTNDGQMFPFVRCQSTKTSRNGSFFFFFFQMHKSQQNKHTKKWENVAQSKEQKKSVEIHPKTEGLVNYAKIFCVR